MRIFNSVLVALIQIKVRSLFGQSSGNFIQRFAK
uniref:Uncharacterized protein n=1 Tax=Arundo donax TaxID=35708 RepID=A0A0A8YMR2_ARUDO